MLIDFVLNMFHLDTARRETRDMRLTNYDKSKMYSIKIRKI